MPSLTLLAADPHLIPVRTRPALAFNGRNDGVPHRGRGERTRFALPLRRRHGAEPTAEPAASLSGGTTETIPTAEAAAGRGRWFSLRRRGVPSPSQRRSLFGWRAAIVAALVVVIVTGLGVLRVWPPFAVVMSGSMAPTINTGDMVVLQRLHAPARVGQVVAVSVPDDARARYGYPPVVIHRVFRITDGQIRTKGDARPAADPFTVPRTEVNATVVADIPAGGRILSFFHSGPGLVWLLFGAALMFGLPLLDRLRDARGREADATADLRDQLEAVSAVLAHLQAEQERSRQTAAETLGQLDRLTCLVSEALGQPAAEDDRVRGPENAPVGAADPAEDDADRVAAPAQPGSSTPGSEPAASSVADPSVASVLESAWVLGSDAAGEPARTAESAPTSGSPEPDLAPAGLSEPTVTVGESEPESTVPPPSTGQPLLVSRPTTSDTGDELASLPVRDSLTVPAEAPRELAPQAIARASDVVRALAPVTPGPVIVPFVRWDAPPATSTAHAACWAAPPAPARSSRFQRPGRLIAASLAQPSPAA